jgi:hypothetical protein
MAYLQESYTLIFFITTGNDVVKINDVRVEDTYQVTWYDDFLKLLSRNPRTKVAVPNTLY